MGNVETTNVTGFADRIEAARRRTEVEVNDPRLAIALPAAMRRVGFSEKDMTPNPATVAAWEAKLN